jgi:HPt (histidine-containing phosphotransfer) domain-containing protein
MTNAKLYDLQQLIEIAAGNQDFVDKMVNMFLEMTPALVSRIEAGIQLQDWDEVKAAAHKMKPSLDMMGIDSLHDVIRSIEENTKLVERLEDIPELYFTLSDTLDVVYQQLKEL